MNWESVSSCELAQLLKRGLRQFLSYKNNIIGGPGGIADIDKSKFDKENFIKVGVLMECGRLMG